MDRRDFIRTSAMAGAVLSMPTGLFARGIAKDKVRIGFIGVGLRGCNHLRNVLMRDDVEVPAICDIDPERLDVAAGIIAEAGAPKAQAYTGSEYAYQDLLARSDIDGVIIATPWLWHTKMAVDAMKAGKYAGVEVSAATSMADCWDLVDTHKATGSPL